MTDRVRWLKERQRGVGATDVASLAGVGFLSPQEVYAEKVAAEVVDRPPTGPMALGLALEDHNAGLYSRRTGLPLHAPGLVRAAAAGALSWVYATFDRVALGTGAGWGRPVELKYVVRFGDEWGEEGTDQVPDKYVVQATWQVTVLRACGYDTAACDVSAVDGYGGHRVYTVHLDDALAALLLDLAGSFWDRVERRAGLDGWEPAARAAVADRLAAVRPDTSVALGSDAAELASEIDLLAAVKRDGEAAEERIRVLKRRLATYLGGAQVGVLPDGRRVKQNLIPAAVITPSPYQREARLDVRILQPKKGR